MWLFLAKDITCWNTNTGSTDGSYSTKGDRDIQTENYGDATKRRKKYCSTFPRKLISFKIIFYIITFYINTSILQAGTSVEETKPKANEPPRLIAIGNIDAPNLTFSVYADQHATFVVSAVESLIYLYALF